MTGANGAGGSSDHHNSRLSASDYEALRIGQPRQRLQPSLKPTEAARIFISAEPRMSPVQEEPPHITADHGPHGKPGEAALLLFKHTNICSPCRSSHDCSVLTGAALPAWDERQGLLTFSRRCLASESTFARVAINPVMLSCHAALQIQWQWTRSCRNQWRKAGAHQSQSCGGRRRSMVRMGPTCSVALH